VIGRFAAAGDVSCERRVECGRARNRRQWDDSCEAVGLESGAEVAVLRSSLDKGRS